MKLAQIGDPGQVLTTNDCTTGWTHLNTTVPISTGSVYVTSSGSIVGPNINDLIDQEEMKKKYLFSSPTITTNGTISFKQPETKMKKTVYHDYVIYLFDLSTDDGKKANRKVAEIRGEIELDYMHNLDKHVLVKHAAEISKIPNAETLTIVVKSLNTFNLEYIQESK